MLLPVTTMTVSSSVGTQTRARRGEAHGGRRLDHEAERAIGEADRGQRLVLVDQRDGKPVRARHGVGALGGGALEPFAHACRRPRSRRARAL